MEIHISGDRVDNLVLSPVETVIVIPGVERELVVVHATDLHLTEADERDANVLADASISARLFDQYAPHNAPKPISRQYFLDLIVQLANKLCADAVVFTGDMMHFPSAANLEAFANSIKHLQAHYLYTLGNHDWHFPHMSWNEQTRRELYPAFIPFSHGQQAVQVREVAGLRLIAIDNSNYQVDDKQFNKVKSLLHTTKPSLLFMHIPLFLPRLARQTIDKWKSPILMAAQGWSEQAMKDWKVREADKSTQALYHLMMDNEFKSLHGIFSGHVHFEQEEDLPGGSRQYVTSPGFAGGVRIIRIIPAQA